MIFYLLPILIGLLLSFYKIKENSIITLKTHNWTQNIYVFITAIIFCGGYMTGSDWRGYEELYYNSSFFSFKYIEKEHAFYLLMLFFKKIGFSFFPFLITCKFFVFYIIVRFIKKYFRSFYLPFSLFLMGGALFLFVDNPFRFMIALGIVIISYDYLISKKFLQFLLLIGLASTFHISSLIMFLVYPMIMFKPKKIIIATAYIILFFILTPNLTGVLIGKLPWLLVQMDSYYTKMFEMDYNSYQFGKIINLILFLLILLHEKTIKRKVINGDIIYSITIIYFFIGLIGFVIPTTFRLKYFIVFFYYFSLSAILLSNLKYKLILRGFIFCYMITVSLSSIYSTYVYLPYSNYFVSLFQEDLPFNYRSEYNKNEYRKRTKLSPDND